MTESASGTSTWRRIAVAVLVAGICVMVTWSWLAEDPKVRGGAGVEDTEILRAPDQIPALIAVLRQNSSELKSYLARHSLLSMSTISMRLENGGVDMSCSESPSSPGKTFLGQTRYHRFAFGTLDSPSTRRVGPTYAACPTVEGDIIVGTSAEGVWNVDRSTAPENVRPITAHGDDLDALITILESSAGSTRLSELLGLGPIPHFEVRVTEARFDAVEKTSERLGRWQVYCKIADKQEWERHEFEFRVEVKETDGTTVKTVELSP